MPNWSKIKAEYIRGGTSYRQLCQKYGVSFSTLKRHALQEKWTDLRSQSEQRATTKIVESVASKEARKVDEIQTAADLLLQTITEGIKSKLYTRNSNSVRQITAALKDLKEIKGMKSELDAQEQLARIEKLRKEVQTETTDKEIKVVFSSDLEEFAK